MRRKLKKAPFLGVIALIAIILGVGMFYGSFSKSFKKDKGLISGFDNKLFLEKPTKTIESPNLSLVQENSISGVSCSQIVSSKVLGVLIGEEEDNKEITEYVVQSGDTFVSIAEDFKITVDTILWANNLNKNSILKSDQKLIILPVSGTFHNVKKGDTIDQITKTYKGNKEEVVAFNELTPEGEIYVGDILIIPNGTKPAPVSIPKPVQSSPPLASNLFIVPVLSPYKITQGLHWLNAVDFAYVSSGGSCGKPVLAAAGGTILKVKYGYNGGAGNYIKIIHPNGLITHYGHLQIILKKQGDPVSQGDIIGSIGYSGKTIPAGPSGCHLHFGLDSDVGVSPRNPFAK